MPTLNDAPVASDWLKGESQAGDYHSRDQITLAGGNGVLVTGTVLAQITGSGKYVPASATGQDGSETAVAILFDKSVDTTGDDRGAIAIARQATVSDAGLTFGPTINTAECRATALIQLKAQGVVDRQSA